VYVLEVTQAVL